jgi:hypothetical protein
MSRRQRTAFTGDIALKLELRTTMKNAPQAHTIAKNLLDLFSVTGPDVEWPRRHLLYKDDKQIQVLSVSCSHGYIDPSIYVEVAPLAVMLEELEIAARESREDEMSLESLYQDDIAQDRISDFRDLVFNEKKSRETYGKHYESILKFSRGYAQSALLKQAGLNITVLNWLYEDPLNKTIGLACTDWANLICQSKPRLQFGELPITAGSSKAFKERVQAEIKAYKERWQWLIEPLQVAVALEVIVRPNPDTPVGVLHDLDNIVRDYLIPGIVPGFGTVSDPIWLVDWDTTEKADDKLWSVFRSAPRPPAGTKAGVTRYEVWRLPAVVGEPGFLSVALISDDAVDIHARGDLIQQVQNKVEKSLDREDDDRRRYGRPAGGFRVSAKKSTFSSRSKN